MNLVYEVWSRAYCKGVALTTVVSDNPVFDNDGHSSSPGRRFGQFPMNPARRRGFVRLIGVAGGPPPDMDLPPRGV